jgi:SNF2 family DNA or RNA helicase
MPSSPVAADVFPAGTSVAEGLDPKPWPDGLFCRHDWSLFQHQTAFLRAQLDSTVSLLLAGDPGSGKTLPAILVLVCIAQVLRNAGAWLPCLYVLPANLSRQVEREFRRFAPELRLAVLRTGKDQIPVAGSYDVLLVAYTLPVAARRVAEAIAKLGRFAFIVFDEAHLLRNVTAKRTRFWVNLARGARWVLPMTGTPFVNSGEDLFTLFHLLGLLAEPGIGVPDSSGQLCPATFTQFCARFVVYTSMIINGRALSKPVGTKNIEVLNRVLASRMTRWAAAELLSLPPLITEQHLLDMADVRDQLATHGATPFDQAKVDELLARRRAGEEISDAEIAAVVGDSSHSDSLSTYRRLIGTAKAPLVSEWVADRIAGGGGQTLIFGHHQAALEVIKAELDVAQIPAGLIYGRTPAGQRDRQVLEFQAGQLKVLVLQIEVAGLGLNLEAASHVVFAELPWTAAAYQQAIARAHRAGQRQHVLVSVATVPDSLDEIIAGTIARKATAAAAVLDTTPELEAAV